MNNLYNGILDSDYFMKANNGLYVKSYCNIKENVGIVLFCPPDQPVWNNINLMFILLSSFLILNDTYIYIYTYTQTHF